MNQAKITRLVNAVLTSGTLADAAKMVHISERTLRRHTSTPEFQTAIKAAEKELLTRTIGRVSALMTEAVEILAGIMRDTTITPAARVAAATRLLEIGIGHADSLTQKRLDEIERILQTPGGLKRDSRAA